MFQEVHMGLVHRITIFYLDRCLKLLFSHERILGLEDILVVLKCLVVFLIKSFGKLWPRLKWKLKFVPKK